MAEAGVDFPLVHASAKTVPLLMRASTWCSRITEGMTFADPMTVPEVAVSAEPGGFLAFLASGATPLIQMCYPDDGTSTPAISCSWTTSVCGRCRLTDTWSSCSPTGHGCVCSGHGLLVRGPCRNSVRGLRPSAASAMIRTENGTGAGRENGSGSSADRSRPGHGDLSEPLRSAAKPLRTPHAPGSRLGSILRQLTHPVPACNQTGDDQSGQNQYDALF